MTLVPSPPAEPEPAYITFDNMQIAVPRELGGDQ
jgi:hypothetical protein